jgi:hypothetical protein
MMSPPPTTGSPSPSPSTSHSEYRTRQKIKRAEEERATNNCKFILTSIFLRSSSSLVVNASPPHQIRTTVATSFNMTNSNPTGRLRRRLSGNTAKMSPSLSNWLMPTRKHKRRPRRNHAKPSKSLLHSAKLNGRLRARC